MMTKKLFVFIVHISFLKLLSTLDIFLNVQKNILTIFAFKKQKKFWSWRVSQNSLGPQKTDQIVRKKVHFYMCSLFIFDTFKYSAFFWKSTKSIWMRHLVNFLVLTDQPALDQGPKTRTRWCGKKSYFLILIFNFWYIRMPCLFLKMCKDQHLIRARKGQIKDKYRFSLAIYFFP